MSPAPTPGHLAGPQHLADATVLLSLESLASVFAALPSACLLLTPGLYIAAVSEAYLASVLATRERLVGQFLFDAFPGEPGTPEGETIANLS
jgi:hypothetical protein